MKVLVTGGAGFIGSHIVHHHIQKGDEVWVIDDLSTGVPDNLPQNLKRFDQAKVQDFSGLKEAAAWADRIYHMAAILGQKRVLANPVDTISNNLASCEKLLQAMTPKNHLLLASSSGVYWHAQPSPDGTFHEDSWLPFPSGQFREESYCVGKLMNEISTLAHIHQRGLRCTIARIFNTIGVRQSSSYGMVVPSFIKQAKEGKPITVYGDGQQTRSFCNVHDVVRALDLLLNHPASSGQIFNVGNDQDCTILSLAQAIKKLTKSSSPIQIIPYKEAYGFDFIDTEKRRPNIEKIHQLTGFAPTWSLESTLEEIIQS